LKDDGSDVFSSLKRMGKRLTSTPNIGVFREIVSAVFTYNLV